MKTCKRCLVSSTESGFSLDSRSGKLFGVCKICVKITKDKYRKSEKGKLSYIRQRNRDTREYTREYMREYRKNYIKTEKYIAQSRKYNSSVNHRIAQKKYRDSHPEMGVLGAQRRRARVRSLPSSFTLGDWRKCLQYFGEKCAVCRQKKKLAQDHWIPVKSGGGYTADNIIPLCHGRFGCNHSKFHHAPEKWLNEKFSPNIKASVMSAVILYFTIVKLHGEAA